MKAKCRKLRIKWYCPFTLPIVLKTNKKFQWSLLEWRNAPHRNYGTVQLCRKLSAIDQLLNEQEFEIMVMVNCCNLALNQSYHFRNDYADRKFYIMEIPRKIDGAFETKINQEVASLISWLDSIEASVPDGSPPTGIDLPEALLRDQVRSINQHSWCSIPRLTGSELDAPSTTEICRKIVNHGSCLHIRQDDSLAIGTDNPDKKCLQQNVRIWMRRQAGNGNQPAMD